MTGEEETKMKIRTSAIILVLAFIIMSTFACAGGTGKSGTTQNTKQNIDQNVYFELVSEGCSYLDISIHTDTMQRSYNEQLCGRKIVYKAPAAASGVVQVSASSDGNNNLSCSIIANGHRVVTGNDSTEYPHVICTAGFNDIVNAFKQSPGSARTYNRAKATAVKPKPKPTITPTSRPNAEERVAASYQKNCIDSQPKNEIDRRWCELNKP